MAAAFYQALLVAMHETRRKTALFKFTANLKLVLLIDRGRKAAGLPSVDRMARDADAAKPTGMDYLKNLVRNINEAIRGREVERESHVCTFLKQRYQRTRRVRARWYLALMLLRNPCLILERRHHEELVKKLSLIHI